MEKLIDIGYAKIYHRTEGSGQNLFFIHGWPLHSETFRDIVPRLAESYTCHLIDLPGTGRSEWNADTPISLMGHCETVQRVVDELELEKFAIVAHDSGGIFARHLAANNPEKVFALVMSNTDIPGFESKAIAQFIQLMSIKGIVPIFSFLLRLKAFRHSKNFGSALVYNTDLLEDRFGELFVRPLMNKRTVLNGQMRLIKAWDWSVIHALAEVHERIPMPVQLIWGKNDVVFPLKPAEKMIDQFAGRVEMQIIDRARLFVHEEYPEQFAEYALEFLDSVSGPS